MDPDEVQPTIQASRAFLGVIAQSVAEALEKVTLPQLRILVLLNVLGVSRAVDLSTRLDLQPPSLTRLIDRLEGGSWLHRQPNPANRREVLITLSPTGKALVASVITRREKAMSRVLANLTPAELKRVNEAFHLFTRAAGEPEETDVFFGF